LSVQLGGTSPSAHVQLVVAARSVAAFSPTDLANLVLWLRADLGITLNSGNVSAWADQAGADAAHDVSQGTAGNQPPWVASDSAANNRPSVDPDGSSDRLQAASATPWRHLHDGTGGTLVAVMKATGAGDNQYTVSSWGPTTNDPGFSLAYFGTVTDYWRITVRDGSGQTAISANTGDNTVVDGSVNVVAYRYQEGRSPNEYDLRLDGVEKAAGSSAVAPSSGDGAALMIGARPLSTPDAFSSCPVLELLTFSRGLTDAELTKLEAYLRTVYGTP
jgi:hypothetical protein